MSVYLRRPKLSDDMNEEEVEQTNNQSQDASTQQPDNSRDYTKEFAIINAKIAELERRFNAEKQPLINQRTAIMQAAAKAGISLTTNESVSCKFSAKLFESVIKNSKTDELINLIDSTFSSLPDLSYYMDKKGCTSLAKRLLAFLNDQYWNDGQNHWNDVAEFIRGTLGKANISLSTKEMMKFIDELGNQMQGHNMFIWIFGNQPAKANEVEEQPAPEVPAEEPELIEEPAETLYQEPVAEVPGEEDYQYDPEVHEDAVFYPSETEDQYDTRYFGDLSSDDFPEYDEEPNAMLFDEDDYELNESKRFNLFRRKNKEPEPLPPLQKEIPNELFDIIDDIFAYSAEDIMSEVNTSGKFFGPVIRDYFKNSCDEFWDAYFNYFPERYEWYNRYNIDPREDLNNIWKVWGIPIVSKFSNSLKRYGIKEA